MDGHTHALTDAQTRKHSASAALISAERRAEAKSYTDVDVCIKSILYRWPVYIDSPLLTMIHRQHR